MVEFKQCRKCYGKNGKVAKPGYISEMVLAADGKTYTEVVTECDCHRLWREESVLEAKAKKANLNPKWVNFNPLSEYVGEVSANSVKRIINYTTKSLSPETPPDILELIKSSVIYMYGPNGTQKTTLANYVGYSFLRAGKKVHYCLMNELIKLLQSAERDESAQARLDKISDVDLLIIDEAFDKKKVTLYKSDWQLPFLDSFLRNRIQTKNKGILFVSNVKIEEIAENNFSASIEDLVSRNVKLCNGYLTFYDNYINTKGFINPEELF